MDVELSIETRAKLLNCAHYLREFPQGTLSAELLKCENLVAPMCHMLLHIVPDAGGAQAMGNNNHGRECGELSCSDAIRRGPKVGAQFRSGNASLAFDRQDELSRDTALRPREPVQTWDCVVPIRSAKGFCPPTNSQARFSASVDVMKAPYPNLGETQPKNLWGTANREFGSFANMEQKEIDPIEFGRRVRERRKELGMSQTELAEQTGQSQSNIGWIEQGKAKKPRQQALDLVEPLRTSVDWLLYETGQRETGLRLLSDAEIAQIYRELPLGAREELSETVSKLAKDQRKRRKTG